MASRGSADATAELVAAGGAGVLTASGVVERREVEARVRELAAALRARGVGDGVPVGISVEPSPQLVAAVIGVLAAGGAVVPLDPAYPAPRLALMAQTAGLELVLCDAAGEAALRSASRARPVRVDRDWAALGDARPVPVDGLEGCVYLLFTSGSTGVPKGVAMPASGIAALIGWQVATHPAGAGTRTLQFAASSFDVFFQELLCTWREGGELVVPPPAERRDAFRLARRLADAGVARAFVPFVALQQLAVAAASDGIALPALRQVFTAGEQLQATEPVRELFRASPEARLFNQYGPTETHLATELPLDPDPGAWERLPAIGAPLPYVRVRVESTGDGEPGGELVVGGACVARGYLGQPELTAERFSTDADGVRWYRTGDRAAWRPDGTLEFLGRLDDQVKVRGFRVELGEVEAVLSSHPDVAASVAYAQESAHGGRTLAAAVQPRPGRALTPEAVREHARRQVPDHLVPMRVDVLAELPRTPSGKVDRRALDGRGQPAAAAPAAAPAAPAPATAAGDADRIAGLLCEAIAAELGAPVAPGDALLDLGADSLAAMVAVGALREATGIELSVDDLLDAASIREAAELAASGRAAA